MKVEIYKDSKTPLEPTVTIEDTWYVRITNDKQTISIRLSDDKDSLTLSVDHQLRVLPRAANSIQVQEIRW